MGVGMGFEQKLYRNTGTYEAPTWVEMVNVKDLTAPMTAGESDVTTRAAAGFKQSEPGLIDLEISFGMVYDTEDADFTAVQAALLARSALDVQVLDGGILVAGSKGYRAQVKVFKCTDNQQLGEARAVEVTLKPCRSTHPVAQVTIGNS
jgi:hypothetical protein